MDNVVGEIVFAEADEDLLPANAVVIAFAERAGAQQRQIRPRLRLGQVHGAGPFAGDQPRQIRLLLRLGPAQKDRLDRPLSSDTREKPKLAPFHISMTAASTSLGRPWPPYSAPKRKPFHPASTNCR